MSRTGARMVSDTDYGRRGYHLAMRAFSEIGIDPATTSGERRLASLVVVDECHHIPAGLCREDHGDAGRPRSPGSTGSIHPTRRGRTKAPTSEGDAD